MINTGLDKKYQGKQTSSGEKVILPKGDYLVEVKYFKEWKPNTKNIMVNVRDENGRIVRDEKDQIVKELVKDCTYYVTTMSLEVLDGEFAGERIWTTLTTHPNATFIMENFLYAIGCEELMPSQIEETIGKKLKVGVEISSYDKKEKDKATGLETVVQVPKNEVKSFKKAPLVQTDDTEFEF